MARRTLSTISPPTGANHGWLWFIGQDRAAHSCSRIGMRANTMQSITGEDSHGAHQRVSMACLPRFLNAEFLMQVRYACFAGFQLPGDRCECRLVTLKKGLIHVVWSADSSSLELSVDVEPASSPMGGDKSGGDF